MTEETIELERSGASAPWARLLERHREDWAAQVLSGRSVIDLAAAENPAQTISKAPAQSALLWLDGYLDADEHERLRTAIGEAARRDSPIVIGLETDHDGRAQLETEALVAALDDARVVTQELAAGSLIGSAAPDAAGARERSVHLLVCANVEPTGASAELQREAAPLLSGYVAWLEQANRELRKANARLARGRLGIHDAAAAAVEDRRLDLERRIAELEEQLEEQRRLVAVSEKAYREAVWDKESTLQAPRYRVVDALRELAFSVPGVSLALRLRSKRVRGRWKQ